MKKLVLIGSLALLLSACGGSSDGGSSSGSGGSTTPGSSMDAFFSRVMALIGSSPDNTEPVSIDADAPTTPENTEPATVS